ncbi:uncharacterized protein BJ171DRAFT_542063 [Polychytrium aggregatum]|uniref:uncharacterized protein n=1 Tax=Polychytrium aggregatum TaxID=110093 RepID=UPI0022FDE742|nr:uncharacterized protein BJ171DRAFT_542063 [Polychytrium aggregatum]KAI9190693.1 hypothetical protein BJ171DRAFT_542063 [Polychytrium aggregatum]
MSQDSPATSVSWPGADQTDLAAECALQAQTSIANLLREYDCLKASSRALGQQLFETEQERLRLEQALSELGTARQADLHLLDEERSAAEFERAEFLKKVDQLTSSAHSHEAESEQLKCRIDVQTKLVIAALGDQRQIQDGSATSHSCDLGTIDEGLSRALDENQQLIRNLSRSVDERSAEMSILQTQHQVALERLQERFSSSRDDKIRSMQALVEEKERHSSSLQDQLQSLQARSVQLEESLQLLQDQLAARQAEFEARTNCLHDQLAESTVQIQSKSEALEALAVDLHAQKMDMALLKAQNQESTEQSAHWHSEYLATLRCLDAEKVVSADLRRTIETLEARIVDRDGEVELLSAQVDRHSAALVENSTQLKMAHEQRLDLQAQSESALHTARREHEAATQALANRLSSVESDLVCALSEVKVWKDKRESLEYISALEIHEASVSEKIAKPLDEVANKFLQRRLCELERDKSLALYALGLSKGIRQIQKKVRKLVPPSYVNHDIIQDYPVLRSFVESASDSESDSESDRLSESTAFSHGDVVLPEATERCDLGVETFPHPQDDPSTCPCPLPAQLDAGLRDLGKVSHAMTELQTVFSIYIAEKSRPEIQEQYYKLHNDHTDLLCEFETTQARLVKQEKDLEIAHDAHRESHRSIVSLNEKMASLTKDLREKTETIEAQQAQSYRDSQAWKERLDRVAHEGQTTLAAARSLAEQHQAELDVVRQNCQEREEENDLLRADITNIRDALEARVAELGTTAKQLLDCQKDLQTNQDELKDLRKVHRNQTTEHMSTLASHQAEIAMLKESNEDLRASLSKAQELSEQFEQESTRFKNESASLSGRLAEATLQLTRAHEQADVLRKTLEDEQRNQQDLISSHSLTQQQLIDSQNCAQAAQERLAFLQGELLIAQSSLDSALTSQSASAQLHAQELETLRLSEDAAKAVTRALENQIEIEKHERSSALLREAELKNRLDQLFIDLTESQDRTRQLEATLGQSQETASSLNIRLAEAENSNAALQEELAAAKTSLSELAEAKASIEATCTQLQHTYEVETSSLNEIISALKEQLCEQDLAVSQERAMVRQLQERVGLLTEQYSLAANESSAIQSKLEALVTEHVNSIDQLKVQQESTNEEVAALREAVRSEKAHTTVLAAENTTLLTQLHLLETIQLELQSVQTECVELRQSRDELMTKRTSHLHQIDELESLVKLRSQETDQHLSKCAQLQSLLEAKEQAIETLSSEMKALRDSSEAQLSALQAELESHRLRLESSLKEQQQALRERDESRAHHAQASAALSDVEAQMSNLRQCNEVLTVEYEGLKQTHEKLIAFKNSELARLEQQLGASICTGEELTAEATLLKNDIAQKQNQIDEISLDLERHRTRAEVTRVEYKALQDERDMKIISLEAQMTDSLSKINELQSQFEECRHREQNVQSKLAEAEAQILQLQLRHQPSPANGAEDIQKLQSDNQMYRETIKALGVASEDADHRVARMQERLDAVQRQFELERACRERTERTMSELESRLSISGRSENAPLVGMLRVHPISPQEKLEAAMGGAAYDLSAAGASPEASLHDSLGAKARLSGHRFTLKRQGDDLESTVKSEFPDHRQAETVGGLAMSDTKSPKKARIVSDSAHIGDKSEEHFPVATTTPTKPPKIDAYKIAISFSGFKEGTEWNAALKQKLANCIKQLGNAVILPSSEEYDKRTTHLISPPTSKTVKAYSACLMSSWVIHDYNWVLHSAARGRWVEEDPYGFKSTETPFKGKTFFIADSYRVENAKKEFRIRYLKQLVEDYGNGHIGTDAASTDFIIRAADDRGLYDKPTLDWNHFVQMIPLTPSPKAKARSQDT